MKVAINKIIIVTALVNSDTLPSTRHIIIEKVIKHTISTGTTEHNRPLYGSLGINLAVDLNRSTVMHQQLSTRKKIQPCTLGYYQRIINKVRLVGIEGNV